MEASSDETPAAQDSKKQRGSTMKLEDQINLQHLQELMRVFHEADENGSDGLDIDEFKAAFGEILGQGKSDQQMAILFMKIDTNCDGTVDWDEFCTYMLLEYQEKDTMNKGGKLPYSYPLKIIPSPHHDTLSGISYLPNVNQSNAEDPQLKVTTKEAGRYVTASRDGAVCVWKSNLTCSRTIYLEPVRQKSIWVTSLTTMPNANRIVASTTENVLFFYDLSASSDPLQVVSGFSQCIVAMDYWYNVKDKVQGLLLLGDTGGGVIVIKFSQLDQGLFLSTKGGKQECSKLTMGEIMMGKMEHMRAWHLSQIHKDWTQKVKYCSPLEGFLSCSGDTNTALILCDLHGRKQSTSFRIPKGVSSFDYSFTWNVIATGGLDRKVRLWNPYVPAKPTASLRGHSTAVLHIAFNDLKNHLLSFSKDKELRVWDVQDQACLQVCHHFAKLGPQAPYAFLCNPSNSLLLLATSRLGIMEPSDGSELFTSRETVSHSKPLCCALYNANFNQVVSGCHGGTVSVWDVDSGAKIMQFSRAHGDAEITTMTFDPTGRRLITGGRDGSIKIWNFNNGACLSVLNNEDVAEVTSIVFLKQRIIVGGWNRRLAVYGDTRSPEDVFPKYWGEREHKEDILCMAECEPNLLVSASYDGDIVVWNADSERVMCKMNAKCCSGYHGNHTTNTSFGHAIEKVILLSKRATLTSSAMLVTCGSGGWVRFWSVHSSGLMGEFSVFTPLPPREFITGMDSATSCCANESNTLLHTGDSLGYISIWDVSSYCLEIGDDVIRTPPPKVLSFRAHLKNVVSLSLSEERGLIVSSSVDGCVRLWTTKGRFIGTFGERFSWQLDSPVRSSKLPRKIPTDIAPCASHNTIKTISGPVTSKWKLARNLFRVLRRQFPVCEGRKVDNQGRSSSLEEGPQEVREGSQEVGEGPQEVGEGPKEAVRSIRGKYYQRKTRPRQVIQPIKPHQNGNLILPFTTLKCPEIQEPSLLLPPITQGFTQVINTKSSAFHEEDTPVCRRLTLCDVLPELAPRETVSKKAEPWRKIHVGLTSIKQLKMYTS